MSGWRRILLTGVGGQGVMSAGRWVGEACSVLDEPVVVGQVHGLSQRGGSVQASVVIGGALSAEIPEGMADALVALEPMEGARALPSVSGRTTAIVNVRPLLPGSLQSAGKPYPPIDSLLDPIREAAGSLLAIDATSLAEEAGSPRALNVVALGMLAGLELLPFPGHRLLETILDAALPVFADINRKAFRLGYDAAVGELRAP